MLAFIQVILVVFFFIALVKVWGRFHAGDVDKKSAAAWSLLWVVASVIVLVPNSTAYFAKFFGIGRGADLVVYSALAMLFFIIFRLMVNLEIMQKDITKLTRQISLYEQECKQSEKNRNI